MKHKLFLFTFLLAILSAINIQASERKKYNFNSEWKLRIGDFPKAKDTKFDDSKWKQVTCPFKIITMVKPFHQQPLIY